MNIKHNTTTKTQDISVPAVASHVLVYQDTLVIYNDVNIPPLRVYSIHTSTPQLIGKGVRTEQRYELAARRVAASGGLDVSRDGIIYTIPVSHFAIHAYNMQAKFLSTLDIQDPPHYVPFSNDLYKQSQSEKMQEWQEAIVSFSHIYGLWLVQCQDGSQDVVVESHLPNTESNVHVYHFIDLATGRILQTNLLRNLALKAVQGSNLYFFQSRQQKDGSWNLVAMKVYQYNL